jgi:hypothetical protein
VLAVELASVLACATRRQEEIRLQAASRDTEPWRVQV